MTRSRSAVDEMRNGEEEDGDAGQEERYGEDSRLVAVAAEMADSHNGQQVPDVIDVLDEAGGLARQPKAALDLRDDRNVVGEVGRAEHGNKAYRGGEEPYICQRLEATGTPGSYPAVGPSLVVVRLLRLVIPILRITVLRIWLRPDSVNRLQCSVHLGFTVRRRLAHLSAAVHGGMLHLC